MTTTIITKFSSTSSAVPLATDLVQGELAVNTADKRLFTENSSATIIEIGTNPSSITTGAITASGTVTANSSLLSSNATFTGGTVNGMVIGGSTPQAITGTLITANTNFSGALTGNVTGNLTGNVTGNITGDVTGNVTASSGTTTLNDLVINGTVDFNTAVLTDLGSPVSSTDAATKGYVDTEISNLIGGAPAALDTLNELAAALNDDAAFNTTITNSIATKLPLAGGTMSGAIAMGSNKITGLTDGAASGDAVNKGQLDTKLDLSGGTMTGNIALGSNSITSTATPTTDDELTRKGYVDGILGSATAASTSAANAATSESNAATSATNAATSATNAATSATNAAASYDSFDDRYLGAKASDPTLDNDGDALVTGATYFNSSDNKMKVYTGSAWTDVAPVATSITASQISDVTATAAELNILDGVTATTAELNYVDGVTSNIQTQLDNISVTAGTLTKTFVADEVATITLSGNVLSPVVGVTKEVSQTGVTNNTWDVNSTTENYTRLDSAPATTLSWVANLASTSYDNKSYTPSEDNNNRGILFNPDGTKMYVLGEDNDNINQYTLSTAYDVSTASWDSVDINVGPQDANGWQIAWNNDGTKLYFTGTTNSSVYQYDLTTAYDLSTGSYASKSFSFSTQEGSPRGIAFNSDGTKMYTVGTANDTVYQYSLSTAYDVSTASYDSVSFSVASEDTGPVGIIFNSDGTKMYILGDNDNEILQYSLSTGFDISTASYDSVAFSYLSVSGTSTFGFTFNSDFTKLFLATASSGNIYQFSLPKILSLGTGSFASADVGKTIEANSGVFVLTSTAGAVSETTAPTSYDQVASGSWEMYAVVYNTTDGDLELSGLSELYNLTNASYDSVSFSVASQETDPFTMVFNNDGTSMFVVGYGNDTVYQYTLTTAYDISTASYASKSFSVVSQASVATALAFNSSGTKMYVGNYSNSTIFQYSLSTAFDVSTASYDSVSFSVASQDTNTLTSIAFNSNGTKLYAAGRNSVSIFQYSLSTAYDLSTASYDSVSFSFSSQIGIVEGITFSQDGTKLFAIDDTSDTVYKYNLSTAFDVSTITYASDSFDVSSQEGGPTSITFNSDGTKMYVVGLTNDTIYQYSTTLINIPTGYHAAHTTTSTDSTYWTDINSMTADEAAGSGSVYYAVSTDDRTTWKIADNTDGIRSIVRNNSGTWQYNSNGTYASTTWTNATTNTELNALQEAMEGATSNINTYDLSYATASQVFSVSSQELAPRDIEFNTDGTKMFVLGAAGQDVNEYTLTTGFDVSTASFVDSFSIASQDTNPQGLAFNNDGTKMYVTGEAGDDVNQYNLSAGFDVSSATYSQNFSVSGQDSVPTGLAFNSDGTKMFVVGEAGQDINEYDLTTGFDISTASYSQNFSLSSEDAAPCGLAFNSDGTKMFIVGRASSEVNQYTLTTGFDVSTASFASKTLSVSSQESTPHGITFNSDGSKMYIIGVSGDEVNEYTVGSTSYPNQMNKTQLDAVSDANHFTLGNDLDLAIVFNLTSGTTVPSSDGVSINYDANVLNKGAILGTDYDYDAPAQNKVRITALTGNNLKVRVV